MNNPYVNKVMPGNHSGAGYTRVVDLDMTYEKTPDRHIIESFTEAAFTEEEGREYDKRADIFYTESDKNIVIEKMAELGLWSDNDLKRVVVVHAGITWKNRTWPKERWGEAINGMVENGRHVIVVGRGQDFSFAGKGITTIFNSLTVQQIAFLVSVSDTFVSNDSGMLHVAGTTDTRIVGIFTSAKGEYRVPFRKGIYGHNCEVIKSDIDCYGCLHREPPPVVFVGCARGDYKCLSDVTPKMVIEAVG
jgi:ADP-heptose:LPS heptosyltransferase